MDKIEPEDISEVMYKEPRWLHCHPDKVDSVMAIFGWSEDDVIIEYIESADGEHYFASIRRKT